MKFYKNDLIKAVEDYSDISYSLIEGEIYKVTDVSSDGLLAISYHGEPHGLGWGTCWFELHRCTRIIGIIIAYHGNSINSLKSLAVAGPQECGFVTSRYILRLSVLRSRKSNAVDNKGIEVKKRNPHPMQQIIFDEHNVARFRKNAIVRFLLDAGPFDMNTIAAMPGISADDRSQFAQLIGYSVSGFGDLDYCDRDQLHDADVEVARMIAVAEDGGNPLIDSISAEEWKHWDASDEKALAADKDGIDGCDDKTD